MNNRPAIFEELERAFAGVAFVPQATRDDIPTLWVAHDEAHEILRYLKTEAARPYLMLYDLTAIDERFRIHRDGWPPSDFTVVYHLLSFERNQDIRLKIPLAGEYPS